MLIVGSELLQRQDGDIASAVGITESAEKVLSSEDWKAQVLKKVCMSV